MNFLTKTYLLLILVLSIPFAGSAQRDLYNWEVSPYGGLLTLKNDITLPQNSNFFTYGIRLDRRVGDAFTVGLNFTYIHLDNTDLDEIAGSFIGLTYHWDNGYLFNKRSAVSIFNRIEAGYTDKTKQIENIEGADGKMTFGFENGVKFRFCDRLSADLSLEILGTKQSITEGVFIENLRYNTWKVGVSYHFGGRKSRFESPVFVPSGTVFSNLKLDKIESNEDSLWIVADMPMELPDTLEKTSVLDSLPAQNLNASVSRADSLAIFMHFDSLYQRRVVLDNSGTKADSTFAKAEMIQPDTITAQIDSLDTDRANPRLWTDSISQFTGTSNIQNTDTTAKVMRVQQEPGRVDTTYVINQADAANQESDGDSDQKDNEAEQKKNQAADSGGLTDDQIDQSQQISQNQKDIENLESQRNRNNTDGNNKDKDGNLGTAIVAGAAGVAVGVLTSKDKKQKPDTVFYVSAATQAKIDSLQREINSLKQKQAGGIVAGNSTVVTPPIGMYYAADSSRTDSLRTDSLGVDSLRTDPTLSDSSFTIPDTLTALAVNTGRIDSLSLLLPDSLAFEIGSADSLLTDSIIRSDDDADLVRIDTSAENSVKPLLAKYPVSCNFGLNSTTIEVTDTVQLNKVVTDLKRDFNRTVVLIGHTDKSGNADYNLQLSKKRAGTIRDFLTTSGIDSERITIESKGAENAVEKYNKDARRVDIRLIDK